MEQEPKLPEDGSLSTQLLTKIFGYLSRAEDLGTVAQVCREWRTVVYDPSLWEKVQVTLDLSCPPSPELLQSLQRRRIRTVEVVFCRDPTVLRDFLRVMSSLETFKLGPCKDLKDADLQKVFDQSLPSLTAVELSLSCIGVQGLEALTKRAKTVRKLSLLMSSGINDACLEMIGSEARQLEVLDVYGCPFTNEGLKHLSGMDLVDLNLQSCKQLSPAYERFTILSEGFKALKRLRVYGQGVLQSEVLEFVDKHPHLELLHLNEIGRGRSERDLARTLMDCLTSDKPDLDVKMILGQWM